MPVCDVQQGMCVSEDGSRRAAWLDTSGASVASSSAGPRSSGAATMTDASLAATSARFFSKRSRADRGVEVAVKGVAGESRGFEASKK